MIILGVDPSLRSTGYGVIEAAGNEMRGLAFGEIKNAASLRQSQCLLRIHDTLRDVIARVRPDVVAIESIIYVQSTRVAIIMGHARGAAVLAAAAAGLPVYEYAPRKVKAVVTGLGGADLGESDLPDGCQRSIHRRQRVIVGPLRHATRIGRPLVRFSWLSPVRSWRQPSQSGDRRHSDQLHAAQGTGDGLSAPIQ